MKCNSCKSNEISSYMTHEINNLFKCNKCELIFVEKIPSEMIIVDYYGNKFYDNKKSERFYKIAEHMVNISRYFRFFAVKKFCNSPGKMVDVGFSRGTLMKILKKRGWSVFGTQISFNAYNNAKKNNLNVFLGDLKSAKIAPNSIDLVTFWHVLEHIINPDEYIKETNRILKNNGKLIIEVPNIGSPIAKFFRKKWLGLDLPHHLYHFSDKSLTKILKNNGFEITKREYFSFEQSIFSLFQSILNLFNNKNNVFFNSIKKNKRVHFIPKLYNWSLMLVFILPGIILSLGFGLLKKGDVMRYYCINSQNGVNK